MTAYGPLPLIVTHYASTYVYEAGSRVSTEAVIQEQQRIPVRRECFVKVHLHSRSETAPSPLIYGRLRNLK
jgi:hypothetical protein